MSTRRRSSALSPPGPYASAVKTSFAVSFRRLSTSGSSSSINQSRPTRRAVLNPPR
nr:MAG TPA: hypothetical protein [Caudoviricetes sp.]